MNASLRGRGHEAQQVLEREDGDDDDLPDPQRACHQAGNPDRVSKPTETRLSTINARMRFSKARAYGPALQQQLRQLPNRPGRVLRRL